MISSFHIIRSVNTIFAFYCKKTNREACETSL